MGLGSILRSVMCYSCRQSTSLSGVILVLVILHGVSKYVYSTVYIREQALQCILEIVDT